MYTFEIAYRTCQSNPLFAFVRKTNGSIHPIHGEDNPFNHCSIHLVPGSFNPIHDGHRELYKNADNLSYLKSGTATTAFYEMSIDRANKGTIDIKSMEGRIKQFNNEGPVIISKHPLFYDKTGVLAAVKDIHMHIGIDTALRIVSMHSTVGTQGIRATFHVYPRKMGDKLWTVKDLPGPLPINFIEEKALPGNLLGLSSSDIRAKMGINQ